MKFLKTFILSLALLFTVPTLAGELAVTFTPPTTSTDDLPGTPDTPIPATGPEALLLHRVQYGTCTPTGFGTMTGERLLNMPLTATTFTNIGPGEWCVRVFARNVALRDSDSSNVSRKTIAPDRPSPPSNVLIAGTTAYTVIKQVDRFVMVPVGTVAPNTECLADQTINGYNVVPRRAVTWAGNVQPDVVVARCG